jgi:predicted ribosomally synthesized peptide with nif11-like leader
MSASEAERFANDLKAKPDLLEDLKKSAAGLGLSGVVEFAKQKGYSIDVNDAKAYIEGKVHRELTDEQLSRIAGGKSGGVTTTSTNVATTIEAVTVGVAAQVTDVAATVGAAVTAIAVVAGAVVVT